MVAVYILLGFVMGFAGSYFLLNLGRSQKYDQLLNERSMRIDGLQAELDTERQRTVRINSELSLEKSESSKLREQLRLESERSAEILQLQNDRWQERLESEQTRWKEMQETNKIEFENLVQRLSKQNSDYLKTQNSEHIQLILQPLKERIVAFEQKVDKSTIERNSLKEEIKRLAELNIRISDEAQNLTKALKGDTKIQGNWGELILEKVLERSGLEKGVEYITQLSTRNCDNQVIRPDVIVNLPEEKHLVIDSKVSLVAYEQLVNNEEEDLLESLTKQHLFSVKNHIKLLSEKAYQTGESINSPEFVLLFMPIEASFSVALQYDHDLFNYAWDRKVVIVSPTTLLATLRTISSVWKQEKQNRNALEIAKQSGLLYDKFVGFLGDMEGIGKALDKSKASYDQAMNKLQFGSGNLIGKAEKIKQLGARTRK